MNNEVLEIAVDLFISRIQNQVSPDFNDCLKEALAIQACNSCKWIDTCIMWGEPDMEMCNYEKIIQSS